MVVLMFQTLFILSPGHWLVTPSQVEAPGEKGWIDLHFYFA
jgi:hypothetical protein